MKIAVYHFLYKLLSFLSYKFDNKVIIKCKLALGTTLVCLTSNCIQGSQTKQEPQKDLKNNKEVKNVYSQKDTISDDNSMIFCYVQEEMPEYPGGQASLLAYLNKKVAAYYPDSLHYIEGRVSLEFTIDKKGKVKNVGVKRSVNPALDSIATRIIREMPDWKPGKVRGELIDVKYTVPVTFRSPNK